MQIFIQFRNFWSFSSLSYAAGTEWTDGQDAVCRTGIRIHLSFACKRY